jgi:prevent-host-death family protein
VLPKEFWLTEFDSAWNVINLNDRPIRHFSFMPIFSLTDAKTHLSELIELAASGEEVTITKRGMPVVRLVATVAKPQHFPNLAELRARIANQYGEAGTFIRHMRDSDRY